MKGNEFLKRNSFSSNANWGGLYHGGMCFAKSKESNAKLCCPFESLEQRIFICKNIHLYVAGAMCRINGF